MMGFCATLLFIISVMLVLDRLLALYHANLVTMKMPVA